VKVREEVLILDRLLRRRGVDLTEEELDEIAKKVQEFRRKDDNFIRKTRKERNHGSRSQ